MINGLAPLYRHKPHTSQTHTANCRCIVFLSTNSYLLAIVYSNLLWSICTTSQKQIHSVGLVGYFLDLNLNLGVATSDALVRQHILYLHIRVPVFIRFMFLDSLGNNTASRRVFGCGEGHEGSNPDWSFECRMSRHRGVTRVILC